jgi:hypothetical protein
MKIVRGSYEHKAIAQVLMEALYLLDSDDTTGMCCFNADEFERGRWGVFACYDTAKAVVEELYDYVYYDYNYSSVPDYMDCYWASESDPRRNALAALEKVDNDYLDDLCDHLGYELVEKEKV